ncbi:MAG TPA: response regulator transcription factor [Terriglobales bacterium]|nr:response regulator transcription factor [Terriglobales bacterium]
MSHCVRGETATLSGDDQSGTIVGRVLVVDDSKALRDAVRRLLADLPDWEICGEASNGREGVEKALELRPDVILMDVGMPELDGLEATRRIRTQVDTEVLVFTQYDSRQAAEEAMAAGARGYLPKSRAADLIEALTAVVQHRDYFGQQRAANGSSC